VTDNGHGTLTALTIFRGNGVLYGEGGKAIARDPGLVRVELLIDHGGTPTDPSDDQLIDMQVVGESTGRNDPFCEPAVQALSQIA
jgi:hypothetical protein